MKGSKNCIVNSHGLESASTTVTMMLDQIVRNCIGNSLVVVVLHAVAYVEKDSPLLISWNKD